MYTRRKLNYKPRNNSFKTLPNSGPEKPEPIPTIEMMRDEMGRSYSKAVSHFDPKDIYLTMEIGWILDRDSSASNDGKNCRSPDKKFVVESSYRKIGFTTVK
ncbi:hypothetical protein GWI33_021054 [Rhynchophorus ferrugineus]|uniref:Uncharacterized protein n=1 Tax=Rhynchophorus ferrugineus TaxID=354439 RepID=A0A834HQU2_RHYFE|nr:hypothetical protein GWI33_021054 [Rhynchophorus ferrugineus]